MPTKPSVFISYRRNPSSEFARYIRRELSDAGVTVFLDVEDITKGRFENVISDGIEKADSFLLILAPETLKSEWVQKEVNLAFDLGKNIVPLLMPDFRMEEHVPEEMMALRRLHGIPYNHHYAEAALDKVKTAVGVTPGATTGQQVAVRRFSLPMTMAVIALLIVIAGIFLFSQRNTSNTTLPDPTTAPSPAPTTAIPIVDMPTGVQIMNLDTTATEIILQRTVDAKETANSQAFAESTQIAAATQTQTTATREPPRTTATAVIDLGSTATEALMQRTVVAQGVINATLMAENTRIVGTSTLTASPSPTASRTPTSQPSTSTPVSPTAGYPCEASIVFNSSVPLNVVHVRPVGTSSLAEPIQQGMDIIIVSKERETNTDFWYHISDRAGTQLGYIPVRYVNPAESCPK
jgi:hypothetical protein